MDSSAPPPPAPIRGKLRPWYLVAAMVLTSFVGLYGLIFWYSVASLLRGGTLPEVGAVAIRTISDVGEYAALQQLRSLLAHPRVTFPLAVAQALVSGLLVVASGLAMGGRKGARNLALQALGANAVLVIAAFALTPFQRVAYLEGVLQAVDKVTLPARQHDWLVSPSMIQWVLRIRLLIFDLCVLGLGALALTRARTRTFFEAVARATEGTEEP